jgi:hypothetical protein
VKSANQPCRGSMAPGRIGSCFRRRIGAFLALLAVVGPLPAAAQAPRYASTRVRPRVIATTDGEIDDRCSMIRFLMYANEFDVEGLVYNSSRFHWLGHTWSGVEWINAEINEYARVYPFLRQNAEGYPTPEELRSKVYVGNIANVGEMESDSPGADRIVSVLLDDKPGPVYLQTWGGTNTIARALWKIQHEHPDQIEKVNQKAVVYIILDQDDTFRKYIEPNWPKLKVIGSFSQFGVLAYDWAVLMPASERVFFERPWLEGNVINNHGALAGAYEPTDAGSFRSEGDSPSFMYEIEVGLRSLESPGYGGWGGRFVPEKPGVTNVWKDAADDGDLFRPIWRWAHAFQDDWAARADWCVNPYSQANHPPVVHAQALDIDVAPGSTVKVSVAGSTDPDGDRLSYSWWQYREAGAYRGEAAVQNDDKPVATVQIPADARPGDTIHMIAEVTDSGKPPLTRYARVILTVRGTATKAEQTRR